MSYPDIIDYNEAVQDPRHAFTDPELQAGKIAETPLGLPLALSGGFALTYAVQSEQKKFAVRCFHREIPEAQSRYAAISLKLRSLASPYFVEFDFQARGIRIRGRPFPVVKMDWVEGETLGVRLERASANPAVLLALRRAFADLAAFLERNGVAHGDMQNENVIVQNGALRLIDYDGMFVPGMQEGRGSEVGHKHFQHPGRQSGHFGPRMDRFSFIVLDVSLEALLADGTLHRRFREGGQAIIFKANDFANPSSSEIFRILNGMPALRDSAKKLATICGAPISSVPTLADFIAGRNIPIVAPPVGTRPTPAAAPTYIGAYDVVDGKDFNTVMRRVGDKIELVGQILSVKQGVGKRGKGRGRPYVFINFGIWNRESVKITIWSEGLSNMSTRPNEAWVGKWISVTGLVEPPYEGKHYGRPYQNVGISVTLDNQIIELSEQEAKFRFGRGASPAPQRPAGNKPRTKNEKILEGLRTVQGTATGPRAPRATTTISPSSTRSNAEILKGMKGRRLAPENRPTVVVTTTLPPRGRQPTGGPPGRFARIPRWIWVACAIVILILLYGT